MAQSCVLVCVFADFVLVKLVFCAARSRAAPSEKAVREFELIPSLLRTALWMESEGALEAACLDVAALT